MLSDYETLFGSYPDIDKVKPYLLKEYTI
jgi:hypothetical protein